MGNKKHSRKNRAEVDEATLMKKQISEAVRSAVERAYTENSGISMDSSEDHDNINSSSYETQDTSNGLEDLSLSFVAASDSFEDSDDTKEKHKTHKPKKEHKPHKTKKEHKSKRDKSHKDRKEHKEHKEHKDRKEHKEHKEHKDKKEHKDRKEHKDKKEHKSNKDHKPHHRSHNKSKKSHLQTQESIEEEELRKIIQNELTTRELAHV